MKQVASYLARSQTRLLRFHNLVLLLLGLSPLSLQEASVFAAELPARVQLASEQLASEQQSSELEADNVGIYLLTVGLGERIEARYGHTIVSVVDRKSKRSHNYNWGMFSFSEPYFALNFFLGNLRYWVGDEPYGPMLQRYRYWEKRPVVADTVNLTAAQKAQLLRLIAENMQPGKQYFWYQYFYKNCSTIPRDYLDQVLGGRIQQRYSRDFAELTFRDYVRRNLNRPPVVAFLLDILMNSRLDQPLSKWDEMFYPPKLRAYLSEFPALDDAGQELPERRLLSNPQVLVPLADVPADSWRVHPWFLGLGLLTLSLCWVLTLHKSRSSRKPLWRSGTLSPSFALPLLLWALLSGLLGLVMLVSWIFSGHWDLHHNANLWVFWPVDWLLVPLAWRLVRQRRRGGSLGRGHLEVCSLWLSYSHCAAFFLWFLGCRLGLIKQNCDWVQLYLAPVGLLIFVSLIMLLPAKVRETAAATTAKGVVR